MTDYSADLIQVHEAADRAMESNIQELQDLCRIRSRRWEPEEMLKAADFLRSRLREHGAQSQMIEWADSHPFVVGSFEASPEKPVLLHYNHYDVEIEPAGSDEDLDYPPFAAEIHDGRLYARGVADDKGPLLSRVHAAKAFKDAGVPLPVTVKVLFEGKEHLHSPGMRSFVKEYRNLLQADAILWENSWFDEDGRLLLKLSEKGLLYVKLSVRALQRDGSSQNSSILPHAGNSLVSALAEVVDRQGRVMIPGFYEAINEHSDEKLAAIARVGFDASRLSGMMDVPVESFPHDASTMLRTVPTLTITSLSVGAPLQSVTLKLPAKAEATLEIRLVPGQSSHIVLESLKRHLVVKGFGDIVVDVMGQTEPHSTDMHHPFVRLVQETGTRAFARTPKVEPLTPLVGNQGALAGPPIVGIGIGGAWSASDPNQHIEIEKYREAVHHVIEIMGEMGRQDVSDW